MAAYKGRGCCLVNYFVILDMTALEVKTRIQKILDEVPEDMLPEILKYLNDVKHQFANEVRLNNNFKKILAEDNKLLERLAK